MRPFIFHLINHDFIHILLGRVVGDVTVVSCNFVFINTQHLLRNRHRLICLLNLSRAFLFSSFVSAAFRFNLILSDFKEEIFDQHFLIGDLYDISNSGISNFKKCIVWFSNKLSRINNTFKMNLLLTCFNFHNSTVLRIINNNDV